jgi:hypothetical protein
MKTVLFLAFLLSACGDLSEFDQVATHADPKDDAATRAELEPPELEAEPTATPAAVADLEVEPSPTPTPAATASPTPPPYRLEAELARGDELDCGDGYRLMLESDPVREIVEAFADELDVDLGSGPYDLRMWVDGTPALTTTFKRGWDPQVTPIEEQHLLICVRRAGA